MSTEIQNTDLMSAFFDNEIKEKVVVKAEDIQLGGGGIDFKSIFFEPQVGKSYAIKLIKNPFGDDLTHRKVYKAIPDPERRGKSFHHVSSGKADTDPALNLFFDLNKEKKAGNALAEMKIKKYLGSTNQACVLVQIVRSNDDEIKPGEFRIYSFSSFGPNAKIANLINEAFNPTQAQIEDGDEPHNLFNIFGSKLILVECTEAEYDGQKGRDFTKSSLSKKIQGVMVPFEDGTTHTFTQEEEKAPTTETQKAIKRLIEILSDDKLSIHNYFAYKAIDDPKNTEETNNHLKQVKEKLDVIIPIIRNAKSIEEIQLACKEDTSRSEEDTEQKSKNILSESIPVELQGSIQGEATTQATPVQNNEPKSEAESLLDEDEF